MANSELSEVVREFRKNNGKLCKELDSLSREELLERLLSELALKQHQEDAALERVYCAVRESPKLLRVLNNDPDPDSI